MPYMYPWHRQFDNLNIENLMQTFENLLLQTCTFTKWKLILSNNEDNNKNIDINIACSSCSWIAPPRYWWRPYISHKIMAQNEIFIFSSSSLKPPADGASYYVCSNGGATYIIGEIIAKDNLNIENLMQTIENLLLQTCTFTKWKLILSNNEDNNNNIDIINNKNNSWICFTFLNVFSVKCWSMFNFF